MKTKSRKVLMMGLLTCALLITPALVGSAYATQCAAGPGQEGGYYGQRHREDIKKALNLTEGQQMQMNALKETHRTEQAALHEQMSVTRQALRQELEKPVSDPRKVNDLVSRIKNIQGKMTDNRVENFLEMKKILTPEQFAKFTSILEEKKETFRQRTKKHFWDRRHKDEPGAGF